MNISMDMASFDFTACCTCFEDGAVLSARERGPWLWFNRCEVDCARAFCISSRCLFFARRLAGAALFPRTVYPWGMRECTARGAQSSSCGGMNAAFVCLASVNACVNQYSSRTRRQRSRHAKQAGAWRGWRRKSSSTLSHPSEVQQCHEMNAQSRGRKRALDLRRPAQPKARLRIIWMRIQHLTTAMK